MEQYQDVWCKGRTILRGARPCDERWRIIESFVKSNPPATVVDLGANVGYYSMRLADRFGSSVTAVETHYYPALVDVLHGNGDGRVTAVNAPIERVLRNGLSEPADLVLALSVLHHLDMTFDVALGLLRRLGRTVVLELATEETACGQHRIAEQYVPDDAVLLGNPSTHLSGRRPLLALLS